MDKSSRFVAAVANAVIEFTANSEVNSKLTVKFHVLSESVNARMTLRLKKSKHSLNQVNSGVNTGILLSKFH